MDSGNSGSMQSSSGGDEQDFDSRAGSESISSFFNPSSHFRSTISAAAPHPPPPPYLPHHQIQNPTFFDHYMNTNDNHDLIWSRPGLIRSEHHDNYYAHFGNTSSSSSLSIPTSTTAAPGPSSTAAADGHAGRAPTQASVPKNPKKRTRASRRAPTTVLTTDTTNFRQMVQEFTGIPAAPFSGGSPYPRRMDLFSAASSLRSGGHLGSLGPLLRPSSSTTPPPPPSFLNSSMVDSTNTNNPMSTTTNAAAAPLGASTSNNQNSFILSRDHLLNLQPSMDFGEFLGREIITSSATGQAIMRNNNNNNNGDDDDLMRRWRRSNDEEKLR
ncbi:hypothetical protein ABFX02_03G023400 [Erythranthe guttata]